MLSFVYAIVVGSIIGLGIIVKLAGGGHPTTQGGTTPTPTYVPMETPAPFPTWSPAPEYDKYGH